jgi:DNA-binding CsgD family transcriptional regulator
MGERGRPKHPDILTPRQFEVLELVREGLTNPQIAERLGISPDGAKWHVKEIIWKLGVRSREEAAEWQRERRESAPTAFVGSWGLSLRRRRDDGTWRVEGGRGRWGRYRPVRSGHRFAQGDTRVRSYFEKTRA